MTPAATVWDVAAAAPAAFLAGVLVGFLLANKYRLVKRDRKVAPDDRNPRDPGDPGTAS